MIISASRRTDIPSYYADWFFNRIREGFVYVRNPVNTHQVSKVSLNTDVVDGIVLWTKNPTSMLSRLDEIAQYPYYFQFTLNAYQTDVETNLPSKSKVLIPAFQRLSDKIGPDRIIWRYDPILLSAKYSIKYHITYFEELARRLKDYTHKCTISFIDYYRSVSHNTKGLGLIDLTDQDKHGIAESFSQIAHDYGLSIDTCAETIDLSEYGIGHASCIDGQLLERISGFTLKVDKDKNQRPECGCTASIDIGMYNTCGNGCKYCYANSSSAIVNDQMRCHDANSPLICGQLMSEDNLTERKVSSNQLRG